jgi:hypothetical protein
MKFELHSIGDVVEALRESEAQAPQQLRSLLAAAANQLVSQQHLMGSLADRLRTAADMRAGTMDSESRHLEVAGQVRSQVLAVAQVLAENGRKRPKAA